MTVSVLPRGYWKPLQECKLLRLLRAEESIGKCRAEILHAKGAKLIKRGQSFCAPLNSLCWQLKLHRSLIVVVSSHQLGEVASGSRRKAGLHQSLFARSLRRLVQKEELFYVQARGFVQLKSSL